MQGSFNVLAFETFYSFYYIGGPLTHSIFPIGPYTSHKYRAVDPRQPIYAPCSKLSTHVFYIEFDYELLCMH